MPNPSTTPEYNPMRETFYSIFVICAGIQVFWHALMLLLQLGSARQHLGGGGAALLVLILEITAVATLVGFFIHCVLKRYWLVVFFLSAFTLVVLLQVSTVEKVIYVGDSTLSEILEKSKFWLIMGLAAAIANVDRGKFIWLMFFGLSLALAEVMEIVLPSTGRQAIQFFRNFFNSLPVLFLFMEIRHSWEKKKPFWFLRKGKPDSPSA